MPSSGTTKLTLALLLSIRSTFASRRLPVDLTLTNKFWSKSSLLVNKFISFKEIVFFPSFSLGPTIISFLSELIFNT